MKKSVFSRFFRSKARKKQPEKPVATPEDVQKKLADYRSKEGPASFTSAAVYFVNELESHDEESLRAAERTGTQDS